MEHGFDWNGDGKVTPVEDAVTVKMMEEDARRRSGNSSSGGSNGSNNSNDHQDGDGCCGVCLLWMLAVPAGIIGLIIGISHLVA